MSGAAALWLQIITIVLAPVLALAGVGVGARLTNSGEERQWLRDSRIQAYSAYLLACNTYDVASRQLEESLEARQRADQVSARDEALRAIKDVITCQESVLLLGSPAIQLACKAATDAVYARNEDSRRLLEGGAAGHSADHGQALRGAVEMFREAVRSELLPSRQAASRWGHR